MTKKIFVLCFFLFIITTHSIAANFSTNEKYFPSDTWRTSTPEAQGIDSEILAKTINEIIDKNLDFHSLLIIRNGYIVLDAYFYPFTPNTKHDLASASKSITSALIGIAIDKGYIKSVKDKMLSFFSDEQIQNLTKEKAEITLEDLLTMRSGIQNDDIHGDVTTKQMQNSSNWIAFELNLPMVHQPGTYPAYSNEGVYLLSVILSKATNLSALNFAQKYLFAPLGIYDVAWSYDPQTRYNYGWSELRMTPHDMAKFAYLYLHNGFWRGQQIISPEWIKKSTQSHVKNVGNGKDDYGYLWWISGDANQAGLYSARGRGGQNIIIWPEKNLIIITTGATRVDPFGNYFSWNISDWVKSDKALSVNKKANQLLQAALLKAQKAKQPAIITNPLPNVAKLISGKIFTIQGAKDSQFSFIFTEDNKVIFKENSPITNEFHFNIKNIPEKYQGMYCIPGVISGYWSSDKTFVFDNNLIGNNHNYHYEITFDENGKSATIKIQEKTDNSQEILKAFIKVNALSATFNYGLTGLDHVALAVRDLDKSIKFYTEILGFKIKMGKVYDKTENVTAASIILGQGNTALELIQFHDKNKQLPHLNKNQEPTLCPHIGLETVDFNATMEKLKANHVRIIEGPTVVPHDVKLITIVDPDNYRIDIGQLLK